MTPRSVVLWSELKVLVGWRRVCYWPKSSSSAPASFNGMVASAMSPTNLNLITLSSRVSSCPRMSTVPVAPSNRRRYAQTASHFVESFGSSSEPIVPGEKGRLVVFLFCFCFCFYCRCRCRWCWCWCGCLCGESEWSHHIGPQMCLSACI